MAASCASSLTRLALLAALGAACGSPAEPTAPPPLAVTGPGPFLVSNPVAPGSGGGGGWSASAVTPSMAYVSLPPGTLPGATAVDLRVQRTGATVSAPLVEGGLDPVAFPAGEGDTVALAVTGPAGTASTHVFVIPPRRPPVIVRTNPRPNKRDVSLNLVVQVVFSEPIDAASLTPLNFVLRSSSGEVPGALAFGTSNHTVVQFTPAGLLAPGTDYELVVRSGILDAEGSPLEVGATVGFTTAPAVAAIVAQDLAFVRDSQIQLLQIDGRVVQLTHTGPGVSNRDPAWSPDGRRLAFASNRAGSWDIYTMDADGANVVRLTSGPYNADPAWSPDGRTIAFSSLTLGQGPGYSMGIAVVDVDGGQGSRVLLDRLGYEAQPAWSPDGRKVTFTSDWMFYDFVFDIYVMNADGTNVEPLLLGPQYSPNEQHYWQLAWAPDGLRFAVVACGGIWGDCYGAPSGLTPSTLVVANADGTGLRTIAQAGGYAKPSWSRDGRVIAFSSTACFTCPRSLRFVHADGSAEGLILTNGHSPAWRP